MVNVTDSCFFIRGYKSVPLLFTVPLFFLILATGCTDPKPEPLEQQYFNADSLAPFVEPEFPFITTSVDARNLGAGFPPDNVATRCLALQLGNRAYACFDTDLLRWSVAWTGDFLSMVTMPQVSYRDFHNKGNDFPVVLGEPQLATGIYPGWSVGSPKFNDPRPPSPGPAQISWGPIPREQGRWNGIYLSGKNAVLSYTVGQTEIHELPGSVSRGGITAFTRTFLVDPGSDTLSLVAAEHQGAARSEQRGKAAILYHNTAEDTVTAIGVAGQGDGVRIDFHHNRYATMSLPPRSEKREVTLLVWSGPAGKLDTFRQLIEHTTVQVPDYQKGTEPYWRQTVRTRVQQSPDTAAFVADKLTLPIPNPWKRNVRAVDIAFFDALKGAVVTYDGDVWIVDGINRELPVMEWTRFASGLYGPQSIEIVDGKIYVFGREGIVRLHDLNSDGVADYYENFSNLMAQSMETREWPGSLVAAPGGGFYVSKGAAGNAGPQYNPVAVNGFRYGSRHSGSVLYISADGRSVKQVATGLRMPYLGIHPETGVVTASDQQGHFVPSSPLFLVDEDDYYGVPASAHTEPIPEITPPLLWFPHSVEPSGAGQVWISSRFMGPLNGELVHLSYGRPGLFRILFDSTESHVQGGASLIPARYTAPTMKGAVNPGDGQLYVTGFSLWGANTEELSALLRIRHTGKPAYLPERFKLRDGGIFLRFGHRLDQVSAT
ncbi:MAG: DUF6797 domain-containing protein, partial [Balneolaceae bacterium]|nr:DUF6797 domain-containing protein [Balneolaceae bacterium]